MPTTSLIFEEITSAICRHWRDELPELIATAYPGVQLGTDRLAEWFELSVEQWTVLPRRDGDPDQATLELMVRCLARPDVATGRIWQLAEYARGLFAEVDVPIVDHSVSEAAVIGWVRFDAGVLRDVTRSERDRNRPPLRHVEWTWQGTVKSG